MDTKEIEKVKSLKNEIRNYRYYVERVEELDKQIAKNFYDKTGVKGVSYDHIHGSTNEEAIIQYRLSLIEKGDELAKERDYCYKQITRINDIIEKLEKLNNTIKKAVVEIYINKRSYDYVARQCHVATGTLYRKIDCYLSKI